MSAELPTLIRDVSWKISTAAACYLVDSAGMCSGMCLRGCPALGTSSQFKSNLLFSGDTDIENRLMDTGVGGGRRRWDVWRQYHGNLHYHM